MDEQSGESKEQEVMGEGIDELEIKELVPEWGWRRGEWSWFQSQA